MKKKGKKKEEKIQLSSIKKKKKKKKKGKKWKSIASTLFMKLITASSVFNKTALPTVRRNLFVPHYSETRHIKIPVTRDSYIKIRFLETNLSTQLAKVREWSGRSLWHSATSHVKFHKFHRQRSDFSYFRCRNSFVLLVRSIAFYWKPKRGEKK